MTLSEFIEQVGASKLARALNTTESNIYTWKRLDSAPRPQTAFELIHLSHGALTWQTIYEPFVLKHYKKRKIKIEGVQIELGR